MKYSVDNNKKKDVEDRLGRPTELHLKLGCATT